LYNSEGNVNGYIVKKKNTVYIFSVTGVLLVTKFLEILAIISGRKNIVHHQTKLNVWLAIKMQIFVFFMTSV